MSYDLNLYPRPGTALTADSFRAYFADAERITLDGDQADYSNDDTGVYFSLTFSEPEGSDEKGKAEDAGGPHVWLNVNFCRPRSFGREASSVLTGITDGLSLRIHGEDGEQIDDPDDIGEEMLRQWNAGNDWACRALLAMKGTDPVYRLPATLLRGCWVWSYQKLPHLYEDDIDVFVPAILFLKRGGELKTCAVWPNLIPTAVPKVDLVYVMRNEMPEGKQGRRTKPALVSWDELRAALPAFAVDDQGPLPYILLDYGTAEDAPPEAVRFVHGLPAFTDTVERIGADNVFDEDLLPTTSHPETHP
ncbi:MAG: hypothetical protein ACRC33_20060 [Gemmataceae bacterium]